MEPKKNPKVDLAKNSALYFAIGLCLVLFLSWKMVEYKTYEKESVDIGMLTVNDDEIEECISWMRNKIARNLASNPKNTKDYNVESVHLYAENNTSKKSVKRYKTVGESIMH